MGGLLDVNAFAISVLPARAKVVQLWHGTPLKKLLFDDPNLSSTITVLFPNFRVLPFRKRTISDELYIAASQEVKNKFTTAFRLPADRVAVTGYPRTDSLFGLSTGRPPLLDKLADLKNKRFVIGLYTPTHRLLGKQSIQFLLDDLERIEPRLAELRVVLLVKLHFWHLDELPRVNAQFDQLTVVVFDQEIYHAQYPILPETDFLDHRLLEHLF